MDRERNRRRKKQRIIAELVINEQFETERDAEVATLQWEEYDLSYLEGVREYNRKRKKQKEVVNAG